MALADCRAAVWVILPFTAFCRICGTSAPVTVVCSSMLGMRFQCDDATTVSLRSFGHSASCCFEDFDC